MDTIAALNELDRKEEAEWTANELRSTNSNLNLENYAKSVSVYRPDIVSDLRSCLGNAGLD